MYFEDLSQYEFIGRKALPTMKNIGWLEEGVDYPRGYVEPVLTRKILQLCKNLTNGTRGFHGCTLCGEKQFGGIPVQFDGEEFHLGSAEVHVKASDGTIYVAPNLVYHYVTVHEYLPPKAFLDAVAELPNS
jgi:hypothetical protein